MPFYTCISGTFASREAYLGIDSKDDIMAFHSYTDNYRQVNTKLTVEFHVLVDTEIITSFGSTAKHSNND